MEECTEFDTITRNFLRESNAEFTKLSQYDLLKRFLSYLYLNSQLDLRHSSKRWVSKVNSYKERTLLLDRSVSTSDEKGRVGIPARLRKGLPKLLTIIFVNDSVAYVVPRDWPFKKYPVLAWRGLHLVKLDCQNRLPLHMPKGKVKVTKHGDWNQFYLRLVPVRNREIPETV
jgi:hypothetical protein